MSLELSELLNSTLFKEKASSPCWRYKSRLCSSFSVSKNAQRPPEILAELNLKRSHHCPLGSHTPSAPNTPIFRKVDGFEDMHIMLQLEGAVKVRLYSEHFKCLHGRWISETEALLYHICSLRS